MHGIIEGLVAQGFLGFLQALALAPLLAFPLHVLSDNRQQGLEARLGSDWDDRFSSFSCSSSCAFEEMLSRHGELFINELLALLKLALAVRQGFELEQISFFRKPRQTLVRFQAGCAVIIAIECVLDLVGQALQLPAAALLFPACNGRFDQA